MTAATVTVDFTALLLDTLGHTDNEYTSLLYENGDEPVHTAVMAPQDAVACIDNLPQTANVYFGVNPTTGPVRKNSGRGTETAVTRLAALWGDLDIKPGACPTLDVAHAIIANLSIRLGTRPSVIVESGGGLHPYWTISDGYINGDTGSARALIKRWGRLVAVVSDELNVTTVDSVYDLARMLRVPGSLNNKTPDPRPVTAHASNGGPLTIAEIDERLTELGIHQRDSDDEPAAEEISPPAGWMFADKTCHYFSKVIDGWKTDKPNGGRNPWGYSQHVRLACAHRLGCITEDDHQRARGILADRFAEIVRTTEPRREPKKFEIRDMIVYGTKRAATKTDEQAKAELGGHTHDQCTTSFTIDPDDHGDPAPGTTSGHLEEIERGFWDSRACYTKSTTTR
jgi:hypothetical protein